jgi:hypothetical protein
MDKVYIAQRVYKAFGVPGRHALRDITLLGTKMRRDELTPPHISVFLFNARQYKIA